MSFFDDDTEVIPLIRCIDGDYEMCSEAVEWLSKQQVQIGVLACAGKYRTGKSFLMNRLCDLPADKGFGVGETVQACTKGIWMYKKLLQTESGKHYIAIDTEGIDALDADNTHDVRIFTLALLLSNIFIYNSVGPIDETSLSTLSLMTNVSSCVRVTTEKDATIGELSEFFPHFIWVLRDFTLKLVDKEGNSITQSTYLENSLNNTGSTDERCAIRTSIKEAFKTRTLFTLPRPAGEDHIQNIERRQMHISQKFTSSVKLLRELVEAKMEPHKMGGMSMSGPMYIKLCEHMISGISGGVPVIKDAWSLMLEVKLKELHEEAVVSLKSIAETMKKSDTIYTPENMRTELRVEERKLKEGFRQSIAKPSEENVEKLASELRQITDSVVREVSFELETRLRSIIETIDDKVFAHPEILTETLTTSFRQFGEDCQQDGDMLALWKSVAFDRLIARWLPHLSNSSARAVVDLQSELSDLKNRIQLASQKEASLIREKDSLLQEAREEAQLEILQLREEIRISREDLAREQQRVIEYHERNVSMELHKNAEVVATDSKDENDIQSLEKIHELEMCVDAKDTEILKLTANVNTLGEELSEMSDIRTSLLAQINKIKHDEEKQCKRWEQSLIEMRETNEAALSQIKYRADKKISEAVSERDAAIEENKALKKKQIDMEKDIVACNTKISESQHSHKQIIRETKESELRGRALCEDLQERLLVMHKTTLEDMRTRDGKTRMDQERYQIEMLESQKKIAELQHVRSDNVDLKRRLQSCENDTRELKKAKLSQVESASTISRLETEIKELRLRKDEAVKEREELRLLMMETDRKLAVSNRELQLERVKLKQ